MKALSRSLLIDIEKCTSLGVTTFSIIVTKSVDLRCYFIGLLVGLLVEKIVISVRLCFFVTLFEL